MSAKKPGAPSYISIGTIRVRSVKHSTIQELSFFPTKDFSVSHAGKEKVALLPAKGNSGCGVVSPCHARKGLRIRVTGSFSRIAEAATAQCAVQIEVEAGGGKCPLKGKKKPKWSLRAITIPAGGPTK